MEAETFVLRVNGAPCTVRSDPSTPLAYVVRNALNLKGTKIGCGLEQCGACAVLVDGKAVLSCVAPAGQFIDREIVTIEAGHDSLLNQVKQAFVDAGAAQCGYCMPGLVVAVTGLLRSNPRPTEGEAKQALERHLCRCGTHTRVMDALRRVTQGVEK